MRLVLGSIHGFSKEKANLSELVTSRNLKPVFKLLTLDGQKHDRNFIGLRQSEM